jgi:hypothetical protein
MRAAVTVFLISIVAAFGGCRQPSPPVTAMAGYDLEVKGAGGAFTRGHGETFAVEAGQNVVNLKDRRLTVNGKAYGAIADGASILVDENGKVSVNGQERLPD